MEIRRRKAVKKGTPEGRSEQEGGLGSPDRVAGSGEVAKADRPLARHRIRSRTGLSEYKRNFKWRSPEFCSPEKSLWAGLRSDQFGITREPKFISKRRVPYYDPQISKSFEWTADCDLNDPLEPEAAELHTDHNNNDVNQEEIETVEGPRLPPKVRSHLVDSSGETALALAENNMKKSPYEAPPNQNEAFSSPKKELEKMGNGLHRALQRKADLNISRLNTFPRNSEYQSQFIWKSPHEKSPILAAEQVIYNTRKSTPVVKSPAITSETAYERNFKGSPPVKDPQERGVSEEKEFPSKREEPFQKPAEDAAKQGKSEQKHPKQKNKHHISPKPLSLHTSHGKMNTEYRSKFLSPAQYFYKDGTWSRIRSKVHNQASQNTLNSMWYMEVRELRERAKTYRQRVEGTHFSRYHFNQILSDNNSLWDVSSTSSSEEGISNNIRALDLAGVSEKEAVPSPQGLQQPDSREQSHQNNTGKKDMSDALTVPVKRRLVWDEQEDTEEREKCQSTEEEEKQDEQGAVVAQQLEENNKDAKEDMKTEGTNQSENLELNTSATVSDSSVSSRTGGRLPTPKLRALGGTQRTHHDRTTPTVGGTVLVSPPKFKFSSSPQRKRDLGTDPSKRRSFRPDMKMKAVSLFNSPPAGLRTVDPLPLRQDPWPPNRVADEQVPLASAHQEHSSATSVLKSAKSSSVPWWSPSHRIQGTLKDPEFQHNGNLGNPKMRTFQLPLRERNCNDEDDRLSQISARSAASSSLASQILERAQKRKDFWGKT
ncbi:PREDICTED: nuclear protein MDM1 isoform X3 [Lepidothrix coronata]|uniref:Nuclear protein MDM1 n=1 Tax=Lepidothrix coronata TaxID=321398 RepID=A0A6J0HVU5_9PASS|nr:PREDICTED: nuclear protein MDM1 isoform X3 [Lepidothrix coronata]